MTTHDIGSHLTTSRIARLLRPLRTKCSNLASFSANSSAKTKPFVSVTYASSSRATARAIDDVANISLLTIIPPPERLNSFAHLDKLSRDNLTISRKLYDVRDAFKNIVQVAFGLSPTTIRSRITTLAAMCATVVGEQMEGQVHDFVDEQGDEAEDEKGMQIIDELYDAIPPHYRRYAVVSHALSVILETCPHHPTLFTILLDVALTYNLATESEVLLRSLLTEAFRPLSSFSVPRPPVSQVTQPIHSDYLISLLDKCCNTIEISSSPINHHMFVSILSDVITETGLQAAESWTCKATIRFAREICSRDFCVFLRLCTGLAQTISEVEVRNNKTPKGKGKKEVCEDRLRSRLAKWMKFVLERLHASINDIGNLGPSSVQSGFVAVINFLAEIHDLGLHCVTSQSDSLVNSLASLAAFCLASPRLSLLGQGAENTLSTILRDTSTCTATYDNLVSILLSNLHKDNVDWLVPPTLPTISSFRGWSEPLRRHSLLNHEASFWSCALRHTEEVFSTTSKSDDTTLSVSSFSESLQILRAELVELADQAEQRCFGDDKTAGNVNDKWRWEEMVDCWVRRSPVVAKNAPLKRRNSRRKLTENQPTKRRRTQMADDSNWWKPLGHSTSTKRERRNFQRAGSSTSISTTMSDVSSRSLWMSMSPSSVHTPPSSPSPSVGPEPMPEVDSEQAPVTPKPTTTKRRISGFGSILADAQLNRTVLHAKDTPVASKVRRTHSRPSIHHTHVGDESDAENFEPPARGVCSVQQLSSDDALDLFAWDSSPVKQ